MDSHIDALSSGINGTMVAVCAEDDDRVTEGELLVEAARNMAATPYSEAATGGGRPRASPPSTSSARYAG